MSFREHMQEVHKRYTNMSDEELRATAMRSGKTNQTYFQFKMASFSNDPIVFNRIVIIDNICNIMRQKEITTAQLAKSIKMHKLKLHNILNNYVNFTLDELSVITEALDKKLVMKLEDKK